MTDISFNYDDLYYIETRDVDDKRPKRKWGGYSQDFETADHVYRHEELEMLPTDSWAVCGVEGPSHTTWSLLIFDLDIHKAAADFDPDDVGVDPDIPLVISQNGGFHAWTIVREWPGEGSEDDFHVPHDLTWDIDIRGSYVNHHVVAPTDIPGVGGSYELANDAQIPVYPSARDAVQDLTYQGEQLIEYRPDAHASASFDIDRSGDPPQEMPACYHAGLQTRAAQIDDEDYNSHRCNMLAALCGAAAGYSVEEMVDHFVEAFPPEGDSTLGDRQQTEYQVEHIIEHVEAGHYSPPSVETLREAGIFEDDQGCDCDIPTHGGEQATREMDRSTWNWWADAREHGKLGPEPAIPDAALRFVVREHLDYDLDAIPDDEEGLPWYPRNRALSWVRYEWAPETLGIDPRDDDTDEEVVVTRYSAKDETSAYTWDAVRDIYEDSSERGRYAAVKLLRDNYEFLTPEDTEELHVYNPEAGTYDHGAKYDIGRELDRNLGSHYSQHEKTEIIGRLKEVTVERDDLEAARIDGTYVCVANGVLDVESRELHDHDPKWLFTRRLPVEYDADAECPETRSFLRDITRRDEDWQTMVEMVGHALLPHYDYEAFMVLFGRGSNGKSTWFNVVREFLGQDNVENIPLQDLSDNRFAPAQLVGQWANIGGDLPSQKIDDLGQLKDLTGGGDVWAEKKGQDGFNFENRATMMFAANEPPVLGERSYAVARRILPIRLPYRFTAADDDEHKDRETDIQEQMTTDEELSGLLNLAMDGIDRLRECDDFSLPETKQERLEYYEQFSDHIKMFGVNCLANESDAREKKADVYNAYTAFCEEKGRQPVSKQVFWKQLRKTTLDIEIARPHDDGTRARVAENLTFTDHGKQFAPHYETPDEGAATLSSIAPGETNLTVEGEVVNQETDLPDELGQKLELQDTTDTVTVTVWADANKPDLDVGGSYRLKNVDVQEYQGERQIYVQDHSGIEEVQPGVGNVPAADPGENEQLGSPDNDKTAAATDGGGDITQLRPRVVQTVRDAESDHPDGVPHALVLGKLVQQGEDASEIESAIEDCLHEDGTIIRPKADHYRSNT